MIMHVGVWVRGSDFRARQEHPVGCRVNSGVSPQQVLFGKQPLLCLQASGAKFEWNIFYPLFKGQSQLGEQHTFLSFILQFYTSSAAQRATSTNSIMVCCFAVLWYGCRHKSLLKIGCTKDCADFCEPQETLLVAKSLLCCETCVKAENEHERQRQTRQRIFFRATELRKIPPRTAYIKDAGEREELREKLQHGLRAGQERQAEDMEEKMEDRGYKTDCAEQWTNDYAENIWQLKYAECEDSRGFEEDLLEMKNDIEHCEEFGWSIVHESRWDADYAEESDDRIVPQIGNGITTTSETTDPSPENAASSSEPSPAARQPPAEPPAPAAMRSPTYTLTAAVAPQPTQAQRKDLTDRELMPPPPLATPRVPKPLAKPSLPTPKMSGARLLSPPPSSASQTPSATRTSPAQLPARE